jgi:sugar O-acyltransferase (sialic acid O-acetyltransferase NeuD family)
MKRLAILGASGHGKVVAEIAELSGWSEIVFFDDAFPELTTIGIWPVCGNTDSLLNSLTEFDGCIVAIGDNAIRVDKTLQIQSSNGRLVSLVHSSSVISKYVEIGIGSVVMANAVINPFSRLGAACIVNTASSIDHDCELGNGVHISPGAHIAGTVKIGDLSWVGTGASIKQCHSVGRNVIIGSGAAVVNDIPDDIIVVGVPAKAKKEL